MTNRYGECSTTSAGTGRPAARAGCSISLAQSRMSASVPSHSTCTTCTWWDSVSAKRSAFWLTEFHVSTGTTTSGGGSGPERNPSVGAVSRATRS